MKRFEPVSLILLVGALGFSGNLYATPMSEVPRIDISQQNAKVSGTVEDALGPVTGASVIVRGATNGTIADLDGHFTLDNVKKGGIIQISFIGYTLQDIPYTGQSEITVKLMRDTQRLDEVVVTALGVERDKKALGYAMQELKGDDFSTSREPDLANLPSGKVSGLQIVRSSNDVGGSSKIILRGNNLLTGSNWPLIVIDGAPMDNFIGGADDIWGNSGADMDNGLSDVNPEDIESMATLKGTSAAALYGSRVGSDVILITTKSGRKNEGLGITIDAGITAEAIFLGPNLQNDFGQGSVGIYDNRSRLSWKPKAIGQMIADWEGNQIPLHTYDNIDTLFRIGTSFNEGVSFQQNVKGTTVSTSVNHSDDTSITPRSKLNKTNITLHTTAFLDEAEKWKVDAKVNYVNQNAHNHPIRDVNPSNTFNTIYDLPHSLNIHELKDDMDEQGNMIWYDVSKNPQENPYWVTRYRQSEDTRNRLLGNISLRYASADWFDVKLRGGTGYCTTTKSEKVYAGGNISLRGLYTEESEAFYENNFSFLATARKDNLIDRLGGFVTFGGNLMLQQRNEMNASAGELLIPNSFSLNNDVSRPIITSELIHRRMNSLYGSLQLNWNGYLFLGITTRNDWSFTMSKTNRSYFYPSVSLPFVALDMLPKIGGSMPDWFSFARMRVSLAEVGSDLDPYQLYNFYSVGKDPNGNTTAKPGKVLYDSDVRSELIKSWEAGFDIHFFNNRLGLNAAQYKSNATHQLLDLPMDPFSGYASRKINTGNIRNEGLEISLNGTILDNPAGLSWSSTAQFSLNRNKIKELYEGMNLYGIGTFDAIQIVAPIGDYYGGIYGQTFMRVTGENNPHYGKIVIGDDGLPLISTEKSKVGNQSPDWTMGWTNNFSYKGFDLSFLIDFRVDGNIYSATTSNLYTRSNAAGTVVNGDRAEFVVPSTVVQQGSGYAENTVAVTPQNYWERIGSTGNYGLPGVYTYSATNVHLRNITLGCEFNRQMLKKTSSQRVRLSATCNNVWMIHYNLPGVDPESVAATSTDTTGFGNGATPTSRSYMSNVTVGF